MAGALEYTNCYSAEGKDPPSNECPEYDIKQSDGEDPVMLELWGMPSTSSLPLLPGPLWPGVVAPDIYGSNRTVYPQLGVTDRFMPFPRALTQSELHTDSIFYVNNQGSNSNKGATLWLPRAVELEPHHKMVSFS